MNAGFCLSRLLGLDAASALLAGVSTSGFCARQPKSPSIADLAALRDQGDPESA